jgi:hypothetical protein
MGLMECPECGNEVSEMAKSCPKCGYPIARLMGRGVPVWSIPVVAGIILAIAFTVYLCTGSQETRNERPAPRPQRDSRRAANEASAISALRTLSSAQELYCTRYDTYTGMTQLVDKNLIDSVLADAEISAGGKPKSGYWYTMAAGEGEWCCVAFPAQWGVTGERKFRISEDGVIYWSDDSSSDDFDSGGTPLGR